MENKPQVSQTGSGAIAQNGGSGWRAGCSDTSEAWLAVSRHVSLCQVCVSPAA